MTDVLQQSLHAAATSSSGGRALAVFCGTLLLFVQAAALAALAARHPSALTWRLAARMAVSGVAALLVTQVLVHVVADPRPYLLEHYAPLAHVSTDNGFPSDHTLVAALLTGWATWLSRRAWPAFALGVVLIAAGRLAIGAHHTLDVLGSVLIAALALTAARVLPFPTTWAARPVLPVRSPVTATGTAR